MYTQGMENKQWREVGATPSPPRKHQRCTRPQSGPFVGTLPEYQRLAGQAEGTETKGRAGRACPRVALARAESRLCQLHCVTETTA